MQLRAIVALVVTGVLALSLTGCTGEAETASSVAETPPPAPLSAVASWGLTMTADDTLPTAIAQKQTLLGRHVDIVNSFISWALQPSTQTLELNALRAVSSATRTVMITWEPGTTLTSEDAAGDSLLPLIAAGDMDAQITAFAKQLSSFRGIVVLRFAHEMNGDWYEWSGQPDVYKAAWKRLRQLVKAAAPLVLMAWSVNNVDKPVGNTLESYWPGASEVDLIGIDGYNCLSGWQSPQQVLQTAYDRVARLGADKAIWVTETASCESTEVNVPPGSRSTSKAEWITQLFAMNSLPHVSAVVWFDRDKEFDWRVDSSVDASDALRAALAR